jgi:hypothetical protein
MAFLLHIDDEGLARIGTFSETVERWSGPKIGPSWCAEFDWRGVERGRVIVVEHVYRPRHLPPLFHQRPDELYEVAFHRVKVEHDRGQEWHVPVFASTLNPKKQTTRVLGAFAFADDLDAVHKLVQYRAMDAANRALAHLFNTYSGAVRKERLEAQRQAERDQREQALRQKAAEAGVAFDDLLEGMKVWNKIRRKRYSPRHCFWCGRLLTDPASIVSGIGPECIRKFPALMAAAKAKVLDLGRMRFDADRLLQRFERAGMAELAAVIREAHDHEQLVELPR